MQILRNVTCWGPSCSLTMDFIRKSECWSNGYVWKQKKAEDNFYNSKKYGKRSGLCPKLKLLNKWKGAQNRYVVFGHTSGGAAVACLPAEELHTQFPTHIVACSATCFIFERGFPRLFGEIQCPMRFLHPALQTRSRPFCPSRQTSGAESRRQRSSRTTEEEGLPSNSVLPRQSPSCDWITIWTGSRMPTQGLV